MKRRWYSFLFIFLFLCGWSIKIKAQQTQKTTYCNPLNIDYTYAVYDAARGISYRSGADPAVVRFKGEYYMFVTRSMGYWHSSDLLNWDFIRPESWYFQGSNAPAAHNFKDSVLYVTGDPSGAMSILYTDNPKRGNWKALPYILTDLQDPDLFIDDDGKSYMFWGSSNTFPIKGQELDRTQNFKPIGPVVELFKLDGAKHGWERFGHDHRDSILKGYMEGAWLTKYNGIYYMQYAAPGTEFNVYGDGVYTSKSPLGPYVYAEHNPVFYKPGGFINGAGHGSTVLGPNNHYWHFGSMSVSVNVNWERRLCMYPTWFDHDGMMYSDTRFGDYPHFAPDMGEKAGRFSGWMLLSYKKPIKASSSLAGFSPSKVVDEDVHTFWVAASNDSTQWLEIDLEKECEIHSIQLNYHDYKSNFYGKVDGLYHRYTIEGSKDGKNWFNVVDKTESYKDSPNDYVELTESKKARYIRFKNLHCPGSNLALSDIRIFGHGGGKQPSVVKDLKVKRSQDRLNASVNWTAIPGVQGYNVLWGIAPDKLYNSYMIYGKNSLEIRSLNSNSIYYFQVEAFNENGVSPLSKQIEIR